MLEQVENFIAAFRQSLTDATFVKATLGNYRGNDEHLQKINLRLIETKKGRRLFFLYKYTTRDTAKNYDFDTGLALIDQGLEEGFRSGHLFTTTGDYQLDIGGKGKARLNIAKPTVKSLPKTTHDREKQRLVDPNSLYLRALGITTDQGEIREKQQDKWRQINKFVETLASFVDKSQLAGRDRIEVVDMGCGKGYLTFAAYDYFKNTRGVNVTITGVELRSELVSLCNDIARASEFDGLKFVEGTIDSFEVAQTDILIALHACDTATDDAIYKGIRAGAELIVAVPCCHKELRPQMKAPAMLKDVLKHGVMLERVAETMTDGLRSLLLEREGYATRLFEFVAIEHTPKNNMLVATRLEKPGDRTTFDAEIESIKEFYCISHHQLETLLQKPAREQGRNTQHGLE